MESVVGVRAKVARALELLLQLDEDLHAYLDTDPIALERQVQPDGEAVAIVVRVTAPPPIKLSLLVGEVAHQLRSALDHLAYELVLAAGNEPTRSTAFPVLLQRPAKGLKVDGGVTPAALAAIEEFQPYQRTNSTAQPLHVLTTLWNIDKHRHLHLTILQSTNTQVFLGTADCSTLVGGQLPARVVGDGAVIATFHFPDGQIDPDLELTASGSNFIALGDTGPWPVDLPVQTLLERLHQYIGLVVLPRLELLLAPTPHRVMTRPPPTSTTACGSGQQRLARRGPMAPRGAPGRG